MRFVIVVGSLIFTSSACAGDLTYTPVNPNFGGNPFNGTPLLQSADVQRQFTNQPQQQLPDFSGLERAIVDQGGGDGGDGGDAGFPDQPDTPDPDVNPPQ